jgi:transcriptional regulator with XRE-family HTH domain
MKRTLSKPDPYQIPVGRESDRQHRDRQQHDRLLIATTVRMARAALGWSQAEFGRFLGMSQRAIHRIEQGRSEPRRTTLLAIESLLRKAGFKIEDRSDGGFSLVVPGTMLGESAQPVDVAAPSLGEFWPVAEGESEETEPARH